MARQGAVALSTDAGHHGSMRAETRDDFSGWYLLALATPLAGLALLLGIPTLDAHWEHHPSHFWLVIGVALLNVALGLIVSEVSHRSGDQRLFLVSMVLLTSAGFLALHALATPGVVLSGPNGGFVLATPVGLLLASGFAALSAIEMDGHTEAMFRRWRSPMRIGSVVVLLAWAVASLAGVSPLDEVIDAERAPWLLVLLPLGVGRVRVRRMAIPPDLPGAPTAAAPRRGRCVRVPGRGPDRDGVRSCVAGIVVGVACLDGGRVRHDRVRRAA